eukprot:TRINITY_DN735_c0_g2_i2.p2 TRINITY_DN735_c0_g2~~TRINITY_DN735_c0_g2_i2.p2  ORF type:complete len:294 (-),score=37.73 TRINITY_DN735_c0_g2_i2:959-1840(-)
MLCCSRPQRPAGSLVLVNKPPIPLLPALQTTGHRYNTCSSTALFPTLLHAYNGAKQGYIVILEYLPAQQMQLHSALQVLDLNSLHIVHAKAASVTSAHDCFDVTLPLEDSTTTAKLLHAHLQFKRPSRLVQGGTNLTQDSPDFGVPWLGDDALGEIFSTADKRNEQRVAVGVLLNAMRDQTPKFIFQSLSREAVDRESQTLSKVEFVNWATGHGLPAPSYDLHRPPPGFSILPAEANFRPVMPGELANYGQVHGYVYTGIASIDPSTAQLLGNGGSMGTEVLNATAPLPGFTQ